MRGFLAGLAAVAAALIVTAQPAAACAGLIGPNGAVNLLRTTTFAGYHNGVEHYVTSFQFAGGSGQFGSLIPLPGIPDKVEKGGDWTLQRLIRETNPILRLDARSAFTVAAPQGVQVIMEVRIDALDITVLKGGGAEVGQWATEHGMRLDHSAAATSSLLTDLRSDKGMGWIPQSGWLTKIAIDASASQLTYDLAVDAKGTSPSRVAAGLQAPASPASSSGQPSTDQIALIGIALASLGAIVILRKSQSVTA